jgi:FkbM family methyltransferase
MSENGLEAGLVRGICPITQPDEMLIRSFPRYQGPGTPGFVTDFIGMKTRIAYFNHMNAYDGQVLDFPIPGDVHYSGLEWAGTLRAVRDAVGEMVVVELGAGFGPWLVASVLAGRARGIKQFRLVGVEGSRHHYEYMLTHFRDNGLDPADYTLLHGISGALDGVAEFPVLDDPRGDWGAVAVTSPGTAPAHAARTERLRTYSLGTLLTPFSRVDLIHIDIQGHEAEVVAAGRDVLRQKVKRLVIGTHSRTIEQQLFDELGAAGWRLEAEEPTIVRQVDSGGPHLYVDGCQVWRNPALIAAAAAA